MIDIADQEGSGMTTDGSNYLTWPPRARRGTDDSPTLEIQEDPELDPDDEKPAKTSQGVIGMLGLDPLDMDADTSKEIPA